MNYVTNEVNNWLVNFNDEILQFLYLHLQNLITKIYKMKSDSNRMRYTCNMKKDVSGSGIMKLLSTKLSSTYDI